jgi:hypothetical protein
MLAGLELNPKLVPQSLRLERCLGPRLRITGIVDPDTYRAEQRRASRLATEHASSWADCQIFSSIQDAARFSSTTSTKPNLIILGTPPSTRGDSVTNRDGELQCARLFPGSTLLVEKPLSSQAPSGVRNVLQGLNDQHVGPVGVGYMLRYLKGSPLPRFVPFESHLSLLVSRTEDEVCDIKAMQSFDLMYLDVSREIIRDKSLVVMGTHARYIMQ